MTAREAAAVGKSFNKDCVGCHSTSFVTTQDSNGEWVSKTFTPVDARPDDVHYLQLNDTGDVEGYNVGCERCPGPGSRHIINLGDPKKILQPGRDFTAKQQNELCGSCHSRGTSVNGKHEYPLSAEGVDYGNAPGDELFGKYRIDKPGLWPDGKTSRQHHQQIQDLDEVVQVGVRLPQGDLHGLPRSAQHEPQTHTRKAGGGWGGRRQTDRSGEAACLTRVR